MAARLAIVLMLASGFAGLGYQIVWTQQSAVWLGHEATAMLAIIAAFFGGLGLGAFCLGRRIDVSARPARWYAGCEAVIGLWGLALVFLMEPAARAAAQWLGPQPPDWWHWTVAFGGTFLLLLPATVAMGATLPALERMVSVARTHRLPAAALYAANTFGAVLGVTGAAFVLVPALGLENTALICVGLNLICALVASRMDSRDAAAPPRSTGRAPLVTLAITGLLGIGYEVLVVRVLSQVAENTIFTFAILLAVYLVGTAIGAAAYARWGCVDARNTLLRWQALACIVGISFLVFATPLKQAMTATLGPGVASALLVEASLACVAFLLPTMVMGALFSHLITVARAAGASFGEALGINTLAAAVAPILFGVWLLPMMGTTWALWMVAAGYLLLANGWRSSTQVAVATVAAALALWHPMLAAVSVPEGGRLLSHTEGVAANVSVVEDAAGVATLHINNRQQEGSSVTQFADARQALLPMLLHPAPERVLFLGLGTGATARSAAIDPALRIDVVELLPEVIAASAMFAQRQQSNAPRSLRIMAADARRYVRSAAEPYDVIIADNFHPARSGSASLYTREHFAAVRGRLSERGLFCQWLPLHQLDLTTTRSIVRTYLAEFPHAWALLATNSLDTPTLGLLSRRDGRKLEIAAIRAALHRRSQAAHEVDIDDDFALLGSFVAGPAALQSFAAGAPVNTDDHPVVAWLAPRITYEPDSTARSRLLGLLGAVRIAPDELTGPAPEDTWSRRIAAYWEARDRYLTVGSSIQPTGDVDAMLAQVRGPLLGVLATSPDFRPAYDPLVNMARALGETDVDEARSLLTQLAALNPHWPSARAALTELAAR